MKVLFCTTGAANLGTYDLAEATANRRRDEALEEVVDALARHTGDARFAGGLAGWQIKRLDRFIDQHLDTTICRSQLAAVLNLSVSRFSHAFKQAVGVAPRLYVSRRRIEMACKVMLATRRSLTDIALSHGFYDQAHFSRTFRREMGLTPQRWRKQFCR